MPVPIRLQDFIAWPGGPLMPEHPPWQICADAAALVRAAIPAFAQLSVIVE
jgi:hypothetical protein